MVSNMQDELELFQRRHEVPVLWATKARSPLEKENPMTMRQDVQDTLAEIEKGNWDIKRLHQVVFRGTLSDWPQIIKIQYILEEVMKSHANLVATLMKKGILTLDEATDILCP